MKDEKLIKLLPIKTSEKTIWTDILGGDDEIGNVDLKRALEEVPEKTIWTAEEIKDLFSMCDEEDYNKLKDKKFIPAEKVKELKERIRLLTISDGEDEKFVERYDVLCLIDEITKKNNEKKVKQ